jgi:hypothetical protein
MADMFTDDPEMKLDTLLSNVDARWEHRFSSTDCGASADMGASSTRTLSEQGVAKRARVDTGNDLSMDDRFLRSLPLGSSRHLSNPRPISSGGCASNSYDESIVGVCETTNHRAGFFRKLRTNGRVLTFFVLAGFIFWYMTWLHEMNLEMCAGPVAAPASKPRKGVPYEGVIPKADDSTFSEMLDKQRALFRSDGKGSSLNPRILPASETAMQSFTDMKAVLMANDDVDGVYSSWTEMMDKTCKLYAKSIAVVCPHTLWSVAEVLLPL